MMTMQLPALWLGAKMHDLGEDGLTAMRASGDYTIVLDDDPLVAKFIEGILGVETRSYTSSARLRKDLDLLHPCAVFVDVHLGAGECGLEIVPLLKMRWLESPLIVLTSDTSDSLVGRALALGADDFVWKPLRPAELIARVLARKHEIELRNSQSFLRLGDIKLDVRSRTLIGSRGKVFLSPKGASILAYMIQSKGIIVNKLNLKHHIWGGISVNDNAIDRQLFDLRWAIKDASELVEIKTIYGQGFVLKEKAQETTAKGKSSKKKLGIK